MTLSCYWTVLRVTLSCVVSSVLLFSDVMYGQARLTLPSGGILLPSDQAVLSDTNNRRDLRCNVSPKKPQIGMDLRFFSGYVLTIPLEEIAGDGGRLRVLSRVTPVAKPQNAILLADRLSVPPLDSNANGEAEIRGGFMVGPGHYQVDLLIKDDRERVCSAHWDVNAKLENDFESVPLDIASDTVEAIPSDSFSETMPVARDREHALYAKVLVNFSPGPGQTTLNSKDLNAITHILRGIVREPRFRRFSLVAFSMEEERIFYQQEPAPRIDFPSLGAAVKVVRTGTIQFDHLRVPQSATAFLTRLLSGELGRQQPAPDAIIVVSPKIYLDEDLSRERLAALGFPACPVFYLNYNPSPHRHPWRGVIGKALQVYRALDYSITTPKDLGAALRGIASHLTSHK
jgi:hypothetical protein